MTNKHTHQTHSIALSGQSHTTIEQILVSSGPVATVQHPESGGVAGQLHSHPLDAAGVISRVSARLPADQAGEWPRHPTHINPGVTNAIRNCTDSAPTQSRLSGSTGGRASLRRPAVTLLHLRIRSQSESRANIQRPGTGTNSHPSGPTNSRGNTPIDPDNFRKAFMPAKRPSRGVWQDKGVLTNAASASLQPAPDTKSIRVRFSNNHVVRSQNRIAGRQKSGRITLWGIDSAVMSELEHIASQEGLSLSQVGKTALGGLVHQRIHDKHEAMLYPTVRKLVREENRTLGNRLVFFQMRTAFASEQTRILTTNLLSRFLKYLGVPDEIFNNLVDQSNKMAKRNIIARNPDFKSLIEEWWQSEPDQKPDKRADGNRKINTKPNRKEKR